MFSNSVPVVYHQQEEVNYCGAASAQMTLNLAGATLLEQDSIYRSNHEHTLIEPDKWWTGPDGLEWTLQYNDPAQGSNQFRLFSANNEASASRRLVWSIHHHRIAPIALVRGGLHWLVVSGFTTTSAPQGPDDTSYAIQSFDIRDPSPHAPSPAQLPGVPPPHGPTDGCGTGIVTTNPFVSRGTAIHNVPYSTWQSGFMMGVLSGHWQGQYICASGLPQPETTQSAELKPPEKLRVVAPSTPPDTARPFLSPARIQQRARQSLSEFFLENRPAYAAALAGSKPETPLLVQRLDQPASFYSIVGFSRGQMIPLVVAVDSVFGTYVQSAVHPTGSNSIFPTVISEETALSKLLREPITLPNGEKLVIRKESVGGRGLLVWKPCRESISPFFPFYQFVVGQHILYVRIDLEIFAELHSGDFGL